MLKKSSCVCLYHCVGLFIVSYDAVNEHITNCDLVPKTRHIVMIWLRTGFPRTRSEKTQGPQKNKKKRKKKQNRPTRKERKKEKRKTLQRAVRKEEEKRKQENKTKNKKKQKNKPATKEKRKTKDCRWAYNRTSHKNYK